MLARDLNAAHSLIFQIRLTVQTNRDSRRHLLPVSYLIPSPSPERVKNIYI